MVAHDWPKIINYYLNNPKMMLKYFWNSKSNIGYNAIVLKMGYFIFIEFVSNLFTCYSNIL